MMTTITQEKLEEQETQRRYTIQFTLSVQLKPMDGAKGREAKRK